MWILSPNSSFSITPRAGALYWLNSTENQKRRKLIDAVHFQLPFWWTDQHVERGIKKKEKMLKWECRPFLISLLKQPGLVVYGRIFNCKLEKPTLLGLSRKGYWEPSESLGYLEDTLQGGYHCSLPWVYNIDTTAAATPASVDIAFTARDSSHGPFSLFQLLIQNWVVGLPPVELALDWALLQKTVEEWLFGVISCL